MLCQFEFIFCLLELLFCLFEFYIQDDAALRLFCLPKRRPLTVACILSGTDSSKIALSLTFQRHSLQIRTGPKQNKNSNRHNKTQTDKTKTQKLKNKNSNRQNKTKTQKDKTNLNRQHKKGKQLKQEIQADKTDP